MTLLFPSEYLKKIIFIYDNLFYIEITIWNFDWISNYYIFKKIKFVAAIKLYNFLFIQGAAFIMCKNWNIEYLYQKVPPSHFMEEIGLQLAPSRKYMSGQDPYLNWALLDREIFRTKGTRNGFLKPKSGIFVLFVT